MVALVLAIAGAVAAEFAGTVTVQSPGGRGATVYNGYRVFSVAGHHSQKIVWLCGLVAFFVFGMTAAIGLSARARVGLRPLVGQAHAGVVRYVVLLAGVFTIATISLYLFGVKPDKLLLGGAVTGVLLGIAAQQSLSNLFAGLVLLFASPFRVGDRVRFRAGAISGEIEGTVTDLSLAYVRLDTVQGQMLLPNSLALAAAVLLIPDKSHASQAPVAPAASPPGFSGTGQASSATTGAGADEPAA